MTDDEDRRILRLVLRRPEVPDQVRDLEATPQVFDSIFPKAYYAHQLRLAGHDWSVVANKLHYSTGWQAESAVHRWLTKTFEDRSKHFVRTKEELQAEGIRLDLERLDKLQASYWDEAIGGDLPSAQFVLRVIAQRSALTHPSNTPVTASVTNNTLVVGGTEAEYVAALMRARDALPGPAPKIIDSADDEPDMVD